MRKLLVAATALSGLLVFAGSAQAADPVVDPAYDWSGIYIGGHASGALASVDWEWETPNLVASVAADSDGSGFGGGIHGGIQKQWDSMVLGIEASYTTFDLNDTEVVTFVANERELITDIDDLIMVDARLGFAQDRWMGFVKGGYASAEVGLDSFAALSGLHQTSSGGREHGFNLGAGVDYAVTDQVIIGADYTYVHLFGEDRLDVDLPGTTYSNHLGIDTDMHVLSARLAFKFGSF